jgi:pimeloyl-ACP methyl ester carboxylesterase
MACKVFAASALLICCFVGVMPGNDQSTVPLGIALESYPYPYPVNFFDVEMQGQPLRMAYMDVPPTVQANGKTIVLFHGKNFGGYYWANTIKRFAGDGYRVVIPDQIGWGKSSKPDIHYSFQSLASNTLRLLDRLKVNRIVLIGHSTGGMLAIRFARSYPDRVEALILEDPIGLEDFRLRIPPQSDETLFQAEIKNVDPAKIRNFYSNYFAKPDPSVFGPLAEVQIRVTLSGEYYRWAKASALAYRMIYEQPVIYENSHLAPPTLLMMGEQDRTAPFSGYASPEVRKTMGHNKQAATDLVRQIPKAKLSLIPNAGHIPHIEQFEAFHQAVAAFLKESAGSM